MKNSIRDIICGLAAAYALSADAVAAFAETLQEKAALIPAEVFAQLPDIDNMQLSPDGTFLAYKTRYEGRSMVIIQSRDGKDRTAVPFNKGAEISWFKWANNNRVLISFESTVTKPGRLYSQTRLTGIDKNGDNYGLIVRGEKNAANGAANFKFKQFSTAQYQDNVIDFLPDDDDHILLSIRNYGEDTAKVRKMDVQSGEFDVEQYPVGTITGWLTDQQSVVRFGWGRKTSGSDLTEIYRQGNDWVGTSETQWAKAHFDILGFYEDPRFAYAKGRRDKPNLGLFKVDMVTGDIIEEVFTPESVDIQGLVFAPSSNRPIGVSYVVDHTQIHYWDTYAAKLQAFINKALPGTRNRIVDQVKGQRQYLIEASSDVEDGQYFFLDLQAKSLVAVGTKRPSLDPSLMSPVEAVTYQTRDGHPIPAYLTRPHGAGDGPTPLVVLPHGGPHARDDADFNYLVQFLASRGYAVFQPNFRGSSGFGPSFLSAGYKQWGGAMQKDVEDGMRWLIERGLAQPETTCIVGISYGGYAALMGGIQTPELYSCVASINGVTDLPNFIGQKTHNYRQGAGLVDHIGLDGAEPEAVSPYHLAEKLKLPTLLIGTEDDAVVPLMQARRLAKALKSEGNEPVFVTLENGDHDLRTEEARTKALSELRAFLDSHISKRIAAN